MALQSLWKHLLPFSPGTRVYTESEVKEESNQGYSRGYRDGYAEARSNAPKVSVAPSVDTSAISLQAHEAGRVEGYREAKLEFDRVMASERAAVSKVLATLKLS